MIHETNTVWKQGLHFVSKLDDREVDFDATAISVDYNQGVSPKKIVLSALAGCTGMDVAALLTKKYKVPFSDLSVAVSGELTDRHPKYYHKINVRYAIKVKQTDRDKVREAIELSTDKYCGVHAMLSQAATIEHSVNFN